MSPPTIWEHSLAILSGLVLPIGGALQHLARRAAGDSAGQFDTRDKIVLYWSNAAFMILLAVAVVVAWRHGGGTLAELGITAPPARLRTGSALALSFLALYALDTWWQLWTPERLATTRARWRRNTPFMPATPREVRHASGLLISAAVGEEIVFRGFLIGYLGRLLGGEPWAVAAAVALPALVFAIAHVYQGVHAVLKIALLSVLFGAILVVTGSLWIPMALHLLVDLVGILLGRQLLAAEPDAAGTSP